MPMVMLSNTLDGFLWVDIVSMYLMFFKLSGCILVTFQIKKKICVNVYSVHKGMYVCALHVCLCRHYNN